MKQYTYNGPAMRFDKCIANNWKGETTAPSESKARNNLAHQFRQQFGMAPNTKITLPGKLIAA